MPPAFLEIVTIANGKRQQVRLEFGAFPLDNLETFEVSGKEFGTAPDGAQRADKMLLAETRRVQPDVVDGVVMPEVQVIPAILKLFPRPKRSLSIISHFPLLGFDMQQTKLQKMILHCYRPFLGSPVACYPAG